MKTLLKIAFRSSEFGQAAIAGSLLFVKVTQQVHSRLVKFEL